MRPWLHARSSARDARPWTDDLAVQEFMDITRFDGDELILTCDNTVFAVKANGLHVKGALSYPELSAPWKVLENVRLRGL